jgi:predicted amidohydrolase
MASLAPLKVAVFQSACADAPVDALIAALQAALADPAARGCDLLACPELFLGGYRAGPRHAAFAETPDGPFAQVVAALARRHGCAISYGYPERGQGLIYNSAVAIGADGALLANRRKCRLPNDYEKQWFATGAGLTLFTYKNWRIALLICYEAEFPELVRAAALAGADLVIVPTALSAEWTIVARAMIPTRAFENGFFLAYANHAGSDHAYPYLGESCIVSPDGRDLARAGASAQVISATLEATAIGRARERIPYLSDSKALDDRLAHSGR